MLQTDPEEGSALVSHCPSDSAAKVDLVKAKEKKGLHFMNLDYLDA